MASGRKRIRGRRVTPERSGLAERNGKAPAVAYDRIIPAVIVGLVFLAALIATAGYHLLDPSSRDWPAHTARLGGLAGLLLVLTFFYALYLRLFERETASDWRRLAPHAAFALLPAVAARLLDAFGNDTIANAVYYTPLATTAMVFAIAYGARTAAMLSMLLAAATGIVLLGPDGAPRLDLILVLLGGALAAALTTGRIRHSSRPLKVGFAIGLVQAALAAAAQAAAGKALDAPLIAVAGLSGVICGVIVLMLLVLGVIEYAFRVTTDLHLLELSDQNHRLLRRLAMEAPGTYHHSQVLGNLAEAAAEAIGANPLLLRVGAYFHDVGKINKPEYFSENESGGGSMHARLSPAMSTLIIAAHTKDGTEIARDYGLPKPIIDMIQQHHGTSLIEFFYHKAVDDQGGKAGVKEEFFRHPGPKPRTKEAGILMLADSVESASRALSDPTPSRIERQVHEIISRKLMDGQMNECNLTLAEVHRVEQSLVKGLTHIFHGRVKYPRPVAGTAGKPPAAASEICDPLPLG